ECPHACAARSRRRSAPPWAAPTNRAPPSGSAVYAAGWPPATVIPPGDRDWRPVCPIRTSKTLVLQDPLQAFQTASADEPDGPSSQTQLLGDFVVRLRRVLEEQQRDHLAAARWQHLYRLAYQLFPFQLRHQLCGSRGVGRKPVYPVFVQISVGRIV